MVGLEYKDSVADKCVFICVDANGHLIIVAVYMDDFLFISKSLKFVKLSKLEMSSYFEMKDLGPAKWILQMELNHDISNSVTTLVKIIDGGLYLIFSFHFILLFFSLFFLIFYF